MLGNEVLQIRHGREQIGLSPVRKRHFLAAGRAQQMPQHLASPVTESDSQGQEAEVPGGQRMDQAGAQQIPVARQYGVCRGGAQGPAEKSR